jgi:hypothetical protein
VSITPFGRPVVPEEYGIKARSEVADFLRTTLEFGALMKSVKCCTCLSLPSPISNILFLGMPAVFAASKAVFKEWAWVRRALAPESDN